MNAAIQIVIGGLLQGSVFALLALGLSLVYRVTGVVNLSQGAFCVFGALLMYTFQVTLGWPAPLAVLAASLGAGLLGLLCLGLVIGLVASLWGAAVTSSLLARILLLVLAGIQVLVLAVLGTGLGILWRHRGDYAAQRQSVGD